MNRQWRVLVVDDLKQWREQLTETLQGEGYYTDSASSVKEVLERLSETFYHLLLLDVRLDHADLSNQEGIDLLGELKKHGLGAGMKVIILSGFGTKERMRQAFREYKVADFLSKDDLTRKGLRESVGRVLSEDMEINLALNLHWQQVSGPEQAVLNLELDGTRIRRNTPLHSRIAVELEDLLCRLFHGASNVLLRPLSMGRSGTGVLSAQPFYANGGGGRPVIVKFGALHAIEEEHQNFMRYVQPFIGGGRTTTVLDLQCTPRLGGIIYSLLGADNDQFEDFGSYYQRSDLLTIKSALDRLFLTTCNAWYANRSLLQPYDLSNDYQQLLQFTHEKLASAVAGMQKSVQVGKKIYFKSLPDGRAFSNPLLEVGDSPIIRSTYICMTHGDFTPHNLFADASQYIWLIDFQSTGYGHILRDVAKLDTVIRYFLLAPEEASLEERLCMEDALASIERFSQVPQLHERFKTANSQLAKAYATVVHLRTLAQQLVKQNPGDDISEYYVALYYNSVNVLRFHSLHPVQREHALLSASILVDRLGVRG